RHCAENPGGDPDMNLIELQRALRQLRCSGMAAGLETRLLEAQTDTLAPIDFLSTLVQDELLRRQDRLLDRRITQAGFRDRGKTLDTFDFDFNKKIPRRLVFELATGRFVTQHEDGLFHGPPGTGKSHLAQAIGLAVIQQGHRVLYREAHVLLEELADAQLAGPAAGRPTRARSRETVKPRAAFGSGAAISEGGAIWYPPHCGRPAIAGASHAACSPGANALQHIRP